MSKNKKSEMKVLGLGLPRTGTSSLKIAFERLLGGECYHMTSFMFDGSDYDLQHLVKARDGKALKEEWQQFLEVIHYSNSQLLQELFTGSRLQLCGGLPPGLLY